MKQPRALLPIALITAALLALSACAAPEAAPSAPTSAPEAAVESGVPAEPASPFSFDGKTITGESVDETLFTKNKLTMVNVWATFCGYCIKEMPDLEKLSAEYADKGFAIVGVVGDIMNPDSLSERELSTVSGLIEKTGVSYPQLLPAGNANELFLKSTRAYPTTFFVDGAGTVIAGPLEGARGHDKWANIIDQLLEKAATGPAAAGPVAAEQEGRPLFADLSTTDLDGNPVDVTTFGDVDLTLLLVWNPEEGEDAKDAFALIDDYAAAENIDYASLRVLAMPTNVQNTSSADFLSLAHAANVPQLLPTAKTSAHFQNELSEFYLVAPWGEVMDGPMAADSNVNTLRTLLLDTYEDWYVSRCCG